MTETPKGEDERERESRARVLGGSWLMLNVSGELPATLAAIDEWFAERGLDLSRVMSVTFAEGRGTAALIKEPASAVGWLLECDVVEFDASDLPDMGRVVW